MTTLHKTSQDAEALIAQAHQMRGAAEPDFGRAGYLAMRATLIAEAVGASDVERRAQAEYRACKQRIPLQLTLV